MRSRLSAEGGQRYRRWLYFLTNVGGGGFSYPWRGALFQILLFPVSMWFPISLVCTSRISSQLPCLFPFSVYACTRWFAISCSSFLFSLVNSLPTPAIVVVSLVSRLLDGLGRMLGIFGATWVQLSQYEYFFPLHLANPCTSAKNISVWAEWLLHSGRAPSELSETSRWRSTPCPASIRGVALHIAL